MIDPEEIKNESPLIGTPSIVSAYSESSIFSEDQVFISLMTGEEQISKTPPIHSVFAEEDTFFEQYKNKSIFADRGDKTPALKQEPYYGGFLPPPDFEELDTVPEWASTIIGDNQQTEGPTPDRESSVKRITDVTPSPLPLSDQQASNSHNESKGKVSNMNQEERKNTLNDDQWKSENDSGSTSNWSEFFGSTGGDMNLNETPPSQLTNSSLAQNRQILNLLFVIDVSGSMRGQRIGMVNYALENIFKELKSKDDTNAVIKVGMLEFSEDAQWVTPQPVQLDRFVFTKIEAQPWLTNFGPAFDQLNSKLSRKAFMNPDIGEYFAPVILFVTDGEPTDVTEYPYALERLYKNGWFRQSAKYAIAVGEEARSAEVAKLLSQFTGDANSVRYADEGEALCSLIQYVAIRASQVQTSMVSSGSNANSSNNIFDYKDPYFSSLLDQQ